MKSTFYLILILFISSSCRKKDINVPFDEIQGDYEWFYSSNGVAFDVSEDQFGIRFTKNGRVKLFKNGELMESDKIFETTENTDGGVFIFTGEEDESIFFSLKNDTLWTRLYPQESYKNYYLKTK